MKSLYWNKIIFGLLVGAAPLPALAQATEGTVVAPASQLGVPSAAPTPEATPLPGEAGLPAPVLGDVAPFAIGPEHLGLDPTLTPIGELTITTITADGVPRQYGPDASGKIVIDGLRPGPVAILAIGPALHAATAVYVPEATGNQQPTQVYLPVMRIAPEVILKHARGYLIPSGDFAITPDDFRSWDGRPVTRTDPFTGVLSPDGVLQGRLISLVRDGAPGSDLRETNITLISPAGVSLRAISDADGNFSFPGVAPGPYGLIAAGPAGYAAHAVEVLPPTEMLPQQITPVSLKANQPDGAGTLEIVLIPPPMIPALVEIIELAYGEMLLPGEEIIGPPLGPPLGPPMGPPGLAGGFGPGGGFGGGSGGGGGIGGGLGGLAALAPLALLPLLIDELDDDDEDFVPVPASPAIVAP